jgi:hypothetical protein
LLFSFTDTNNLQNFGYTIKFGTIFDSGSDSKEEDGDEQCILSTEAREKFFAPTLSPFKV